MTSTVLWESSDWSRYLCSSCRTVAWIYNWFCCTSAHPLQTDGFFFFTSSLDIACWDFSNRKGEMYFCVYLQYVSWILTRVSQMLFPNHCYMQLKASAFHVPWVPIIIRKVLILINTVDANCVFVWYDLTRTSTDVDTVCCNCLESLFAAYVCFFCLCCFRLLIWNIPPSFRYCTNDEMRTLLAALLVVALLVSITSSSTSLHRPSAMPASTHPNSGIHMIW